ncbi:unnamed protein product [Calypogeia fissa]
MYRPAPRYESRSNPEKPSRSARSSWVEPQQNRPYVPLFEEDDRGLLRDPYLAEDAHILDARDYQQKGTSSGTADLREAQRLAANFFSQYPSASTGPEPVYRDAPRFINPLSPEVTIDRYPPRGQNRDRDVGVDRWAGRPNPETFPSSRSQLLLEDWEEERVPVETRREQDLYGVPPVIRERKRDDAAWDDNEYDYGVVQKEADFAGMHTTSGLDGGGLRVTKRLDWTGLFRPDGGSAVPVEDGFGLDMRLSKRENSQTYGGVGRPFVDSYRAGVQDELNAEGSAYSRRGGGYYGTERYRDVDVHKGPRGSTDERLPERDGQLIGRNFGIRGGERGGRGREDWKLDRETSAGQIHSVLDSDRGKNKRRFDDRDSRRPFDSSGRHFGGGSGSGPHGERDFPDDNTQFGKVRGGKYGPKRDFSQRASITNRDILAVYYGNQGPRRQSNNFAPTRPYPYPGPSRHNTQPSSGRYGPQRSSRSPARGRPGWQNFDVDSARNGNKRRDNPVAIQGKRFKRETQSDKLYLMHNSKAKSEEKEQEAAVSLSVAATEAMDTKEGNGKGEASEPVAIEDLNEDLIEELNEDLIEELNEELNEVLPPITNTDAALEGKNPLEPSNGLWDNEDSWSESEDEGKQTPLICDGPSANDASGMGEGGEQPTSQALQSGDVNDSKNFLGECSEDDDDDDADWESLASDLDDQLDDVCVHQGLDAANAMTENPQMEGLVTSTPERKASEESGRVGTVSVAQSQDSEMVDFDNFEREEGKKDVAEVDSSSKEGSVGIEKKKVVVIMEELQESVKNREDKAFDNYVSLFEQDTDLKKLYEGNVNSGSFECLVCAGVGAKKKKKFPDVASLVQHAKKILRTKKLPEHRGFARAVCKILGWETVPGPSIILPRGCVPRQQSEPIILTVAAPKIQVGVGENSVGSDWEWAAARQLFEEQEARIDRITKSSGELLQTDNTTTRWPSLSNDGMNSETAQGPGGFVTVVDKPLCL